MPALSTRVDHGQFCLEACAVRLCSTPACAWLVLRWYFQTAWSHAGHCAMPTPLNGSCSAKPKLLLQSSRHLAPTRLGQEQLFRVPSCIGEVQAALHKRFILFCQQGNHQLGAENGDVSVPVHVLISSSCTASMLPNPRPASSMMLTPDIHQNHSFRTPSMMLTPDVHQNHAFRTPASC